MTTPTALDTHDMVLVHRVFRRELLLLPRLVRSCAGDADRAARVRAHGEELLGFLHHHHTGEDELVWPRLRERVALEQALVDRMERQHGEVDVLAQRVTTGFALWHGDAAHGEQLADALQQLHAALVAHLDEEEAHVLPLVQQVLTQAEWDQLGERGFAAVAPRRRLVTLGHILEDADDGERAAFLAHVPAPARLAYRLVGRRQHAKETTALRIPLQR